MSDHEPWQRRARRPMEPSSGQPSAVPPRQPPGEPPAEPSYAPPASHRRTEWPVAASFGRLLGMLLAALAVIVALIALWRFRDAGGSGRLAWLALAVVLGIVGITAGWLASTIATIRYSFSDAGVTVRWRAREHLVPWDDIREIRYEPRSQPGGWEPIWPGFHVYTRPLPNGTRRVVATQREGRRIELITGAEIIEISPDRPIRFLAEYERERMAHGLRSPASAAHRHGGAREPDPIYQRASDWPATRRVPPSADPRFGGPPAPTTRDERRAQPLPPFDERRASRHRPVDRADEPPRMAPTEHGAAGPLATLRTLFVDRLLGDQLCSTLLAIGVVLPVLMTAYLYNQYEGLPDQLPLHWDALGAVDRVGEPRDLWKLPLMAAVVLVGNGAVATLLIAVDRMLARLLLAATPVAQVVMFIALARAAS